MGDAKDNRTIYRELANRVVEDRIVSEEKKLPRYKDLPPWTEKVISKTWLELLKAHGMIGQARPKTYFEKIRFNTSLNKERIVWAVHPERRSLPIVKRYEKRYQSSPIQHLMAEAAVDALLKMEDEKKVEWCNPLTVAWRNYDNQERLWYDTDPHFCNPIPVDTIVPQVVSTVKLPSKKSMSA